jgi:hypothetical protein
LAWRRIVEGIIVEKLWKHLVNAAPEFMLSRFHVERCIRCIQYFDILSGVLKTTLLKHIDDVIYDNKFFC